MKLRVCAPFLMHLNARFRSIASVVCPKTSAKPPVHVANARMVRGAKRRWDGPLCTTHEALSSSLPHSRKTSGEDSQPAQSFKAARDFVQDVIKLLFQASLNAVSIHIDSSPCHPKREACWCMGYSIALRIINIRLLS